MPYSYTDARHGLPFLFIPYHSLLGGDASDCAVGNTIALNAAAGLYVYGKATSVAEGYTQAKEVGLCETVVSF